MSSLYTQNGVVWDIDGIGSFKIKDIRDTLLISYENEYQVRRRYSKTRALPRLWANCLWLMVYDPIPLSKSAFLVKVKGEHKSVRTVRERVLGIEVEEFATLIGFSAIKVEILEQAENSSDKDDVTRHLLSIVLHMLTTRDFQASTICRLLHLARVRATTNKEHEAVSNLRRILILH